MKKRCSLFKQVACGTRKRGDRGEHHSLGAGEEGYALLSVFGMILSLSFIMTMLIYGINYTLQIEAMDASATQAYWLARSQSLYVIGELRQHGTAASGEVLVPFNTASNTGRITTNLIESNPGVESVTVCATSGNAAHTITFNYNTTTNIVSAWQDSAPAPTN